MSHFIYWLKKCPLYLLVEKVSVDNMSVKNMSVKKRPGLVVMGGDSHLKVVGSNSSAVYSVDICHIDML